MGFDLIVNTGEANRSLLGKAINEKIKGYTRRIACEVIGGVHRSPYAQRRGVSFSDGSSGRDTMFCMRKVESNHIRTQG